MRYLTLIAALLAGPAMAQDFSTGSEAKEWGLQGEQKARFTATVSDLVCTVTGDCPEDCGAGARQIVLIRETDGMVVLALKNGQPVFSGATFDLAPYCHMAVEVDGVTIGDPDVTPSAEGRTLYMVQRIRVAGEEEWTPTKAFTKAWDDQFPDAQGKGPWFRRDPRINALIDSEGYLGLGLEEDAAYIKENY